jgi:hypothetical protein
MFIAYRLCVGATFFLQWLTFTLLQGYLVYHMPDYNKMELTISVYCFQAAAPKATVKSPTKGKQQSSLSFQKEEKVLAISQVAPRS